MNKHDIPPGKRTEYFKTCELCKMELCVFAQADNGCEYETEIYLECQCGDFIEFVLPVN